MVAKMVVAEAGNGTPSSRIAPPSLCASYQSGSAERLRIRPARQFAVRL